MYKLTVQLSGKVVSRHEFEDKEKVVVGRNADCDVVIDNLGVSRAHCEILREGGVYVLHDLKSNNGTYVNGKRITAHNLNDGDEISIGKFSILYHSPQQAAVIAQVEAEAPKKGGGDFTLALDAKQLDARQRDRVSKLKAYLVVQGSGGKKETILLEKGCFVIGNWEKADLKVGGFFTKRKHAIIFREENGFHVVDTSGKSKTYLNGSPCDNERLKDGDLIQVAGKKVQFMIGTPTY